MDSLGYGGIQTAVWHLAKALHDAGHTVSVFGGNGTLRPDLKGRAIDVRTFPFVSREKFPNFGRRFQRLSERVSFAFYARQAVIEGSFDWVIITKPFDFFWPLLMPSGSKTKFVFRSGGTDFFPGDRFLSRYIDIWLSNSHFNAWQIKTRYKHYPTVIYNGVDTERFNPKLRDMEWRDQLGVKENEILFIFAGRLVGWKGLKWAIHALSDPCLRDIPCRLLIIGDGVERIPLERLAQSLGINNRVIFHPAVPHDLLPPMLASADVGIYPSVGDEGFSNSIAEAMSSGKAVIATAFSGNPETVGNEGSCGILVSPGESKCLAEAMYRLASDHVLREKMGKAGRERILAQFTWPLVTQRLLKGVQYE